MNILFLSPNYAGLQLPIIAELERQGNKVTWIEDVDIPYNFRIPRSRLNKIRCDIKAFLHKPFAHHWKKVFDQQEGLKEQKFDLFFCINGRSLCPEFFQWINQMPDIKKVLYVWDSSKIFDFYYYKNEFDKCFAFDKEDSIKYSDVSYLPFYWFDDGKKSYDEIKYDISIVGTDHDNRFDIVSKILPQVKAHNLSYFFKIQLFKPDYSYIAFYKLRTKLNKQLRHIIEQDNANYNNRLQSDIAMTGTISPIEYNKIMDQTACVLDTDRESQCGFTPRVIWALAKGKKIITTNHNFLNAPFYRPEQISIIDRNNPVIDVDFIKNKSSFNIHPYIEKLRIDKWIDAFVK